MNCLNVEGFFDFGIRCIDEVDEYYCGNEQYEGVV